jgi:hypothetical protein
MIDFILLKKYINIHIRIFIICNLALALGKENFFMLRRSIELIGVLKRLSREKQTILLLLKNFLRLFALIGKF